MRAVRFVEKLVEELQIPAFSDFKQVNPADFQDIARRSAENALSRDNRREIRAEDYMGILQNAYQRKRLYL